MTLTAILTIADPRADLPGLPCAGLLAGGLTLFERQVRLLRISGVTRVLVLAESALLDQAPELAQLLHRLANCGDITRLTEAADLARLLDAGTDVLVLADGCLADVPALRAVVDGQGETAMAVWPVGHANAAHAVQLGPTIAFGGILRCPGAVVQQVVRTLGDWDLAQTLVRAVVAMPTCQQIDLTTCPAGVWMMLRRQPDGAAADRALRLALRPANQDGLDLYLHAPVERWLAVLAAPTAITATHLVLISWLAGLAATACFAMGWNWGGLAAVAVCAVGEGAACSLHQLRLDRLWSDRSRQLVGKGLEIAWCASLAWPLAVVQTAGVPIVLAAAFAAVSIAIWQQLAINAGIDCRLNTRPSWMERTVGSYFARRYHFFWLLVPLALMDRWQLALGVQILGALVQFGYVQFKTRQRLGAEVQRAAAPQVMPDKR